MFESSSLAFYVAPIAVTLCFGLAFATLLVLIVIPALILLLEDSKGHLGRHLTRLLQSLSGFGQLHAAQTDKSRTGS
jgi:Cu/Ag efflux pump CusA